MKSFTINCINIFMVIITIADFITIGGLFHSVIFKRDCKKIFFKIILVIFLFILALAFFHFSRFTSDVNNIFNIDVFLYSAGIVYFLLACISLLIISYVFFNLEYSNLDYFIFIISSIIPYILGLVIHYILFENFSFLFISVIFYLVSIIHGILMSKNYIINKSFIKKPDSYTLKYYDGKTLKYEITLLNFIRELVVALIVFAMGLLIFIINNPSYIDALKIFYQ